MTTDRIPMPNVAFNRFHGCCVLVQNEHNATDEEWQAWLDFVSQGRTTPAPNLRILIFSVGGSPTPKQRSQVHELMPKSGDGVPTAVVTASVVGRAIVTAMSLFNRNVRPFAPDSTRDAFNYLAIPAVWHAELIKLLRQMHDQLNIPFRAEPG